MLGAWGSREAGRGEERGGRGGRQQNGGQGRAETVDVCVGSDARQAPPKGCHGGGRGGRGRVYGGAAGRGGGVYEEGGGAVMSQAGTEGRTRRGDGVCLCGGGSGVRGLGGEGASVSDGSAGDDGVSRGRERLAGSVCVWAYEEKDWQR